MVAEKSATRVVHIIADLNGFGGTESTLLRYLQKSDIPLCSQAVIVLRSAGEGNTIGAEIRKTGVSLYELHLKKGTMNLRALYRIWKLLKDFKPTCISAWLYHPILLAAFLGKLLPKCKQIWHIRSLPFMPTESHLQRHYVVNLVRWLSKRMRHSIVTNSLAAKLAHCEMGFRPTDWKIIPNGCDFERLALAKNRRQVVRDVLGLGASDILLATVGRYCPEKGYLVLSDALQSVKTNLPDSNFSRIHWMGVGNLVEQSNESLIAAFGRSLPINRMHLLGKRADVPDLLAAADIFILPSVSESFPNALIEAIGAGAYPVASNVGGVQELGLPKSCLATPGDSSELAHCLELALRLDPRVRSSFAEEWSAIVRERFAVENMVNHFDQIFANSRA